MNLITIETGHICAAIIVIFGDIGNSFEIWDNWNVYRYLLIWIAINIGQLECLSVLINMDGNKDHRLRLRNNHKIKLHILTIQQSMDYLLNIFNDMIIIRLIEQ